MQLLKTVKDLNPSARTILLTGDEIDNPLLREYEKTKTINYFLKKPIDSRKLVLEVKRQIKTIKQF